MLRNYDTKYELLFQYTSYNPLYAPDLNVYVHFLKSNNEFLLNNILENIQNTTKFFVRDDYIFVVNSYNTGSFLPDYILKVDSENEQVFKIYKCYFNKLEQLYLLENKKINKIICLNENRDVVCLDFTGNDLNEKVIISKNNTINSNTFSIFYAGTKRISFYYQGCYCYYDYEQDKLEIPFKVKQPVKNFREDIFAFISSSDFYQGKTDLFCLIEHSDFTFSGKNNIYVFNGKNFLMELNLNLSNSENLSLFIINDSTKYVVIPQSYNQISVYEIVDKNENSLKKLKKLYDYNFDNNITILENNIFVSEHGMALLKVKKRTGHKKIKTEEFLGLFDVKQKIFTKIQSAYPELLSSFSSGQKTYYIYDNYLVINNKKLECNFIYPLCVQKVFEAKSENNKDVYLVKFKNEQNFKIIEINKNEQINVIETFDEDFFIEEIYENFCVLKSTNKNKCYLLVKTNNNYILTEADDLSNYIIKGVYPVSDKNVVVFCYSSYNINNVGKFLFLLFNIQESKIKDIIYHGEYFMFFNDTIFTKFFKNYLFLFVRGKEENVLKIYDNHGNFIFQLKKYGRAILENTYILEKDIVRKIPKIIALHEGINKNLQTKNSNIKNNEDDFKRIKF